MSRFGGRRRWAAVALVAAATLTACAGLGEAGAAGTVGSSQVSTDLLAAQVEAVQEQRGETPGAPDNALVVGILQRLIITELVGQAATAQDITITQGQIDGAKASPPPFSIAMSLPSRYRSNCSCRLRSRRSGRSWLPMPTRRVSNSP